MNEVQRQHYLHAIGLETWACRFILPHAKPFNIDLSSQKVVSNRTQTLPSVSAERKLEPLEGIQQTSVIQDMLRTLDTEEDPLSSLGEQPERTFYEHVHVTADVPTYVFKLGILPLDKDRLILFDTPYLAPKLLNPKKTNLLYAMLCAIGWREFKPETWTMEQFSWPIAGMQEHTSEEYATEALRGFLINLFALPLKKKVLIFGDFCAKHMLGNTVNLGESVGVHKQSDDQLWVVTYGLDIMLRVPEMKKEAWGHLRVLKEASCLQSI